MIQTLPFDVLVLLVEQLGIKDIYSLQSVCTQLSRNVRSKCVLNILTRTLLGSDFRGRDELLESPSLQWRVFSKSLKLKENVNLAISFHKWSAVDKSVEESVIEERGDDSNKVVVSYVPTHDFGSKIELHCAGLEKVPGLFGDASKFSGGGSSRMEIKGINEHLIQKNSFSISYWINIQSMKPTYSSFISIDLVNLSTQNTTFFFSHGINNMWFGKMDLYGEGGNLSLNTWSHVVISFSENSILYYVNGEAKAIMTPNKENSTMVTNGKKKVPERPVRKLTPRKFKVKETHKKEKSEIITDSQNSNSSCSNTEWVIRLSCGDNNTSFLVEEFSIIGKSIESKDDVFFLANGIAFN